MSADRITATYRVRCPAAMIESRADAIALEQSVELPRAAVRDARVREEIIARVTAIRAIDGDEHDVDIALAAETTGQEAGQLLNMLFGNASLQDDVALTGFECSEAYAAGFGGPRFGIAGLRQLTGVQSRPLTCSALKPQGLPAQALAELAGTFARAGIDIIKDDHGLADQTSAPFALRVAACQEAIERANAATGRRTLYAPSLGGTSDNMRSQLDFARQRGVQMALIAPMISGVATLAALAREGGIALIAHPALAGAARMAPPLLLGRLFRLFGADATIFPNAGGRFGYSAALCQEIASAARNPWHAVRSCMPVPAGGMSVERVAEMRERFGVDTIFLIGGSLLLAGDRLPERCRAFVTAAEALEIHRE